MEKYDIIQCFRNYQVKPTSDKYVVLELFSNNKPKAVIQEEVFVEGNEDIIKFRTIFLNKEDNFPWKVVGKADTSLIGHPHYKVIRKIKLMNAKRKEQGYAF